MPDTRTLKPQSVLLMERFWPGTYPEQLRLVQAWIELRRDELMADWELAINGEKPYKIDPL